MDLFLFWELCFVLVCVEWWQALSYLQILQCLRKAKHVWKSQIFARWTTSHKSIIMLHLQWSWLLQFVFFSFIVNFNIFVLFIHMLFLNNGIIFILVKRFSILKQNVFFLKKNELGSVLNYWLVLFFHRKKKP